MAIRIEGASSRNDDVLAGKAAPDLLGTNQGYTKPGTGPESWDTDVDRARRMGEESHGRLAPQLDQTQAGEARNLQLGGLGLLRMQGEGTADSSAQILSQRANEAAATQAGAAGLGKHPGSNLATFNRAAPAVGTAALAANARTAHERAGEISRGQAGYAAGTQKAQGQDIQTSLADAQLEAQQRALNEARQQGFERRGWNTRNMESQTYDRWQAQREADVRRMENERLAKNAATDARNREYVSTGASIVTGGISGGSLSDERSKVQMGSLGHMMRRYSRG